MARNITMPSGTAEDIRLDRRDQTVSVGYWPDEANGGERPMERCVFALRLTCPCPFWEAEGRELATAWETASRLRRFGCIFLALLPNINHACITSSAAFSSMCLPIPGLSLSRTESFNSSLRGRG